MITDELQKELEDAYYDVTWKMQKLVVFLSFFPKPLNPKTDPPQVVAEQEKVIREFYEASDRFEIVFKRYALAYKLEQRNAYYEQR